MLELKNDWNVGVMGLWIYFNKNIINFNLIIIFEGRIKLLY